MDLKSQGLGSSIRSTRVDTEEFQQKLEEVLDMQKKLEGEYATAQSVPKDLKNEIEELKYRYHTYEKQMAGIAAATAAGSLRV